MFGAITFIPLFFQGVFGVSATSSGNYITPLMLGNVVGSFTSGQVLSRAGGHYRIQGAVGVGIMAIGLGLLSRMNIDTSSGTAVRNMVIKTNGLAMSMYAGPYIMWSVSLGPYALRILKFPLNLSLNE